MSVCCTAIYMTHENKMIVFFGCVCVCLSSFRQSSVRPMIIDIVAKLAIRWMNEWKTKYFKNHCFDLLLFFFVTIVVAAVVVAVSRGVILIWEWAFSAQNFWAQTQKPCSCILLTDYMEMVLTPTLKIIKSNSVSLIKRYLIGIHVAKQASIKQTIDR